MTESDEKLARGDDNDDATFNGGGSDAGDESKKKSSSVIDDFVFEEYKNISKAHFELHNGFRQMFRFYLGVAAVPVTLFAFIYKDTALSLGSLPGVMAYLFVVVALIGLLMYLSLVNIRFDIIFYTRTVNGTRNYFLRLSEMRLGVLDLKNYLMLQGNMRFPPYKETFKAYWWQFLMIGMINSISLCVGIKNITAASPRFCSWLITVLGGIAFFAAHAVFYYALALRRNQSDNRRIEEIEGQQT